MEEKQLLEQLEGLKKDLEGKSKEQVAEAVKGFKEEFDKVIEEKLKTVATAESIEKMKEEMEKSREASIKELQDHLDKLDIKMKGGVQNRREDELLSKLQEKKDYLSQLKDTKKEGLTINVKAAGTMSLANYTGGVVGLSDLEPGLTRVQRRSPFIRQIITNRPVSTSYVSWAEQANIDGGAGATAEGAAKSQADFDIVEASKKVEKITAYIKVTKEALDDISYLNSEIRTELVELLNLKLDADILGADGSTPNIKGILEYATAFSVAGTDLATGVDEANNFDVIRAALWQVVSNNFQPNYVLVNPVDAAAMDMAKASDGHYIMPPFATVNGQTIAGLRVIENNGVTAGDFVVGDFTKSNLGVREDINIQVGYENDDFTKNLVTILGELRAVHYIKSNHTGAFVKGTFSTAKAALETA